MYIVLYVLLCFRSDRPNSSRRVQQGQLILVRHNEL